MAFKIAILHPVVVVIFSGLITSTPLYSFLTPAMVKAFGRKPLKTSWSNQAPKPIGIQPLNHQGDNHEVENSCYRCRPCRH